MRTALVATLAVGCGYSSYWPRTPYGLDDSGVVGPDAYHLTADVPCSPPDDPDPYQLTVVNQAAVPLELYFTEPSTCAETFVAALPPSGGYWMGTGTDNLWFVARGLDGGLVAVFGVPDGTASWTEYLP